MSEPPRRRFLQLPSRTAARIQADVDEELRFELDMRAAELVAQGVSEPEARRRAVAEFGDLERTRRVCADEDRQAQRGERRARWLAELGQDARLAARGLRRTPGFTLVVLLTLALGIGANTAVFSVVRTVLLDRLPYHEPDRLVRLYGATPDRPDARGMLTPADIADLERTPALRAVAPFGNASGYTFVGEGGAEVWQGMSVGSGFFPLLGAPALLGRAIDARDTEPGAPPVVMLSHALWQRAFGGDPGVVGRDVPLGGRTYTIVGVMGPRFASPTFTAELWTPLDLRVALRDPAAARRLRVFRAVGRVADGATPARLRAELALVARQVRDPQPEPASVHAVPLRDAMVGDVRPVLLVVMGAAALVLLIACGNVAGLFLSRTIGRRRELAVRAALGAGRGRLVRQLLTESTLLALLGGALGVVLAYVGRDALVRVAAQLLPSLGEVPVDARVLAFAVALSVGCGLAFGLVPALAGTSLRLAGPLAESGRGAAGGRLHASTGRVLVAAQITLAVVLLVCAGLLGRTLVAIERMGVGYDTTPRLLTMHVALAGDRYAEAGARQALWDELARRLRALPGVRSVGMAAITPWNGVNPQPFAVDGRPATAGPQDAHATIVSEDYFAALGVPLLGGRAFTERDREGATPVALVSERLARERWPGTSPIGQRVRIGGEQAPWREVVGVVADVRPYPTAELQATAYAPLRQTPPGSAALVVRSAVDAMALVTAIRATLRELDPALPLVGVRTTEDVLHEGLAAHRLPMVFSAIFALLALLMAALGVYGVLAYAVAARTREFGIRSALGARRGSVLALVLRQGLATASVGVAAGLLAAAAGARVLASLLVGVSAHDPLTFVLVPALLLGVALLACLLPALRATRVAPLEALRGE